MKLPFPWASIWQLKVHWGTGLTRCEKDPDEIFPRIGDTLEVSHLSHEASEVSQLSLQLQHSPPLNILSSQTCSNNYLSLSYLSWNQPARSQGSREGQRHPEADPQTHTESAWSCQPIETQAKNPPWKGTTVNITDLMVNMKFMVLPSLQWPVQICVTLNCIILQDIAPWQGKANNDYYSGYTQTTWTAGLITQLQERWEARLEMTCRIQTTNVPSGEPGCAVSQGLGLSCHGNLSEVEKFKENIPIQQDLLAAWFLYGNCCAEILLIH